MGGYRKRNRLHDQMQKYENGTHPKSFLSCERRCHGTMADQKTAFQALSSDNRGAIILLTSVSLLVAAIIFVFAKLSSVIYFKQRRTAANTPIWIALIFAVVQVVVVQKAVDHGLGKHTTRLSKGDVQAWSKFAFAAHMLLIVVLALAKMSTILLIWKLTPSKSLRRSCVVTGCIVVGWSVFAVLSIGFQCGLPDPWLYTPERCAGEVSTNPGLGPSSTEYLV